MSHSPTDRPTDHSTDPTDRPDPYYQYRLTVPHAEQATVQKFIEQYSKDWAYCKHFPDEHEGECKLEHFHAVFRDFVQKTVDAFKKAVSKHFARGGNCLHAGKFQDNHVSKAIGYFKHDDHAEIIHSGQSYWTEYVDTEPAFIKSGSKRKLFKESASHPVLTYSNVLKQAAKYRTEHALKSSSLSEIVEHMVNEHNWWPSRELLTNGIPTETHQRFQDMVTAKRTKLAFWLPHERSEKKLEWADRPAAGIYPSGVITSGTWGQVIPDPQFSAARPSI